MNESDRRWRKAPTEKQRAWMKRRVKATSRDQQDILGELIRLGQREFDKKYRLGKHRSS